MCCAARWQSCRRAWTGCSRCGAGARDGSQAMQRPSRAGLLRGCTAGAHFPGTHVPTPAALFGLHPSQVQVFNKQITLFREAVYLLFGYRVEMASDPGVRRGWGWRCIVFGTVGPSLLLKQHLEGLKAFRQGRCS